MALKRIYFRERRRNLGVLRWPPGPDFYLPSVSPAILNPRQWLNCLEELLWKCLEVPCRGGRPWELSRGEEEVAEGGEQEHGTGETREREFEPLE